jgi:hypothetical protein
LNSIRIAKKTSDDDKYCQEHSNSYRGEARKLNQDTEIQKEECSQQKVISDRSERSSNEIGIALIWERINFGSRSKLARANPRERTPIAPLKPKNSMPP